MASSLALNNFPGFCKEAIPQDWFPRGEEVKPILHLWPQWPSRFPGFHWNHSGGSWVWGWGGHWRRQQNQHGEIFSIVIFLQAILTTSLQGTWVANRVTDKLTPVTDSIFCCRFWSILHPVFFSSGFCFVKPNPCDQVRLCSWHAGYHRYCEVSALILILFSCAKAKHLSTSC